MRLTEGHTARAMALRYSGHTWSAIAQQLGCSREALRLWREREGVDRDLADAQREAGQAAALGLALAAGEAVAVLRAVMHDTTASATARVSAARATLALAFAAGLPSPANEGAATPEAISQGLHIHYFGSAP